MGDTLFPALLAPPADRPALAFPDGALTYPELAARAGALAQEIAGLNRVAVWATPTLPTAVGIVAALLAGVPAVPVNPRSGPRELAHIIADAAPDAVLAAPDVALPAPLAQLRHIPADHPTGTRESARPGVRDAEAGTPADARSGDLHLRHDRPAEGCGALRVARSPRTSTRSPTPGRGRPPTCSSTPCRCSTCTASSSACSARCAEVARCATSAPSRPPRWPTRSTAAAPSCSACPPTTTASPTSWARTRWPLPRSGGARLLVSGSAALTAVDHARLHRLTGLAVRERYGLTETLILTAARADEPVEPGTVGRPLAATEVRLVPEEAGDDLGAVEVRGPSLFSGYLGADRPADDARRLVPDRRHRPVDGLGGARARRPQVHRPDQVGWLQDRRRRDRERAAGAPGRGRGGSGGRPGRRPRRAGGGLRRRRGAGDRTAPRSTEHVATLLAPHKRPREVRFVDALPRNDMGKVVKARLSR